MADVVYACSDPGLENVRIGVEVCEDLWVPNPPSVGMALNDGATVILNASASSEVVGKSGYRRSLVCGQSARLYCAYAYANAGEGESTTDLVFSGENLIAENGALVARTPLFSCDMAVADVDLEKLVAERRRSNTWRAGEWNVGHSFTVNFSFMGRAGGFGGTRSAHAGWIGTPRRSMWTPPRLLATRGRPPQPTIRMPRARRPSPPSARSCCSTPPWTSCVPRRARRSFRPRARAAPSAARRSSSAGRRPQDAPGPHVHHACRHRAFRRFGLPTRPARHGARLRRPGTAAHGHPCGVHAGLWHHEPHQVQRRAPGRAAGRRFSHHRDRRGRAPHFADIGHDPEVADVTYGRAPRRVSARRSSWTSPTRWAAS